LEFFVAKTKRLIVVMLALFQFGPRLLWADAANLGFWLSAAESAAGDVADAVAADRAFVDIQGTHIQLGAIDNATVLSEQIASPERRFDAYLTVAAAYAKSNDQDKCLSELRRAEPLVQSSASQANLVEKYLELTGSVERALSFVQEQREQAQAIDLSRLVRVLAIHRFVDEALELAKTEINPPARTLLQLQIAHALAAAAKSEETERVVAVIDWKTKGGDTDYIRQDIWLALACALHESGQFDDARKIAARITHKTMLRREQELLQRIASGQTPERDVVAAPTREQTLQTMPDRVVNKAEADRADAKLEARIQHAKAMPIESSNGQFGPWDQAAELARLHIEYADVARLYSACGEQDLAIKKLRHAEIAAHDLIRRNSFVAMLSSLKVLKTQMEIEELEGLKRFVATTPPDYWQLMADRLSEKLLAKGDIVGAKNLAERTIVAEPLHSGNSEDNWSAFQITNFIKLGEEKVALELLKIEKMNRDGEASCRHAGNFLVESGRSELLKSWLPQISPTARVHVCLGAVDALLESAAKNR
jgi:tetratricopeptide (TPR) repeat protein